MKTLLYIDCCIRREQSRTRQLAEAFLKELEQRGEYEIQQLCLMDENLSHFSEGFFFQREALIQQGNLNHPRFRYAHQFQKADRVVMAAPFWDLSFPALLKVYIENICVDGITFGCDERGCFGTCQAEKLLFLTTRGGSYNGSIQESGARYLEQLCDFWGIPQFSCIAADGLDLGVEPSEAILDRAIAEAKEAANAF